MFSYQEEALLCYLAFKDYEVELALSALQVNIDELVQLILILNDGIHVSPFSTPQSSLYLIVCDPFFSGIMQAKWN